MEPIRSFLGSMQGPYHTSLLYEMEALEQAGPRLKNPALARSAALARSLVRVMCKRIGKASTLVTAEWADVQPLNRSALRQTVEDHVFPLLDVLAEMASDAEKLPRLSAFLRAPRFADKEFRVSYVRTFLVKKLQHLLNGVELREQVDNAPGLSATWRQGPTLELHVRIGVPSGGQVHIVNAAYRLPEGELTTGAALASIYAFWVGLQTDVTQRVTLSGGVLPVTYAGPTDEQALETAKRILDTLPLAARTELLAIFNSRPLVLRAVLDTQ